MEIGEVRKMIEDHEITGVDIKYSDLVGNWYHLTFPIARLEAVLEDGISFDGSSIPGMRSVESGDMVVIPDLTTAIVDPFTAKPTLRMLGFICDAVSERGKRIEFRTSDGTCNYYFAMSALVLAGLDGIKNSIRPTTENGMGPFDDNVYVWSEEKKARLTSVPSSLEEALEALQADHDYLLAGGVFNKELIESWIIEKTKEVIAVRNRPHPFEMNLYYSL